MHGMSETDAELDIRELFLRDLMSRHEGGPCFIAFAICGRDAIDPLDGFVDRFSDLGMPVYKASAALAGTYCTLPTGEAGALYSADVVRWIGDDKALVKFETCWGFDSMLGGEQYAVRRLGKWMLSKVSSIEFT
jgi:hypothetical protein